MKIPDNFTTTIRTLLANGQISLAITQLEAASLPAPISDKVREASSIFTPMLEFFTQGYPDSRRSLTYSHVKELLHQAVDAADRLRLLETSPTLYFSKLRTERYSPSAGVKQLWEALVADSILTDYDNPDLRTLKESEQKSRDLFYNVWTSSLLSPSQASAIQSYLAEDSQSDPTLLNAQALILSALTLGAMNTYDEAKLLILLYTYANSADSVLRARALVGATLLFTLYPGRATGSRIESAVLAAENAESFPSHIRSVTAGMLRSHDTGRVSRKITSDLLPDIIRLRPEIEKRFRDLDPESIDADSPEWLSSIMGSSVEKKLRELSEMQSEGADVFMSAFSAMKGFPFFSEMANWFLPFTGPRAHSSLIEAAGSLPAQFLEVMGNAPVFCSSDKYSMLLSLGKMPAGKAQAITSQMQSQFEGLSEEAKTSLQTHLQTNVETEIASYLKDLYRFFHLFPRKEEFSNPFDKAFRIPSGPLFAGAREDQDLMQVCADFYFRHSYWDDAIDLLREFANKWGDTPETLQKLAYCHEKTGQYSQALEAYRKAELLSPPLPWLLKRVAACLRALHRPAEAAEYLARVLDSNPQDLQTELLCGHTLLEAGKPSEALKHYYKVEYLNPDSAKALRPIAWCEFLIGNNEKSHLRYMDIIGREDVSPTDFLNLGHVLFSEGKIAEASKAYSHSLHLSSPETFRKSFSEDSPVLRKKGIPEIDISLMLEAVK